MSKTGTFNFIDNTIIDYYLIGNLLTIRPRTPLLSIIGDSGKIVCNTLPYQPRQNQYKRLLDATSKDQTSYKVVDLNIIGNKISLGSTHVSGARWTEDISFVVNV